MINEPHQKEDNSMFKEIKGYEGLYWINEKGDVLTKNWRNTGKESILRPATDNKGYLRVALMRKGKLSTFKVHRLVALTFIPNNESKPQVNHINGNKQDNNVENLEWCTGKENMQHAYNTNLSYRVSPYNKIPKKGVLNGNALLTDFKVLEIRRKHKKRICTRKMLATEYNVTESCIKDVLAGKSWRHLL